MRLDNVRLFGSDKYLSIEVDEASGEIINIISSSIPMPTTKNGTNLLGMYITPGFVDTHIHGAFGYDVCDMDSASIIEISKGLATKGISAFCPTTMTISLDKLYKTIDAVWNAKKSLELDDTPHADILGLHLEGLFLNPSKCGVQNVEDSILPSNASEVIDYIENNYPGLMKIVDIAPEMEGGIDLLSKYSDKYVFSIAHSEADYDISISAFNAGAKSVTHVLNAMNPMLKRAPGILGAAIDSDVYVEVISDGHHIHNSYLKLLYSDVLEKSVITVSDSMRGAGMPNGLYDLGGVEVEVRDGRTYFGKDGNLAGSVSCLTEEFANLYNAGINPARIINSMTVTPLRRLGLCDLTSYEELIDIGSMATFNIFDNNAKMIGAINRGKILWLDEV